MAKALSELIADLKAEVIGPTDVPIEDVTIDSRRIKPGAMFVALRGTRQDGHRFVKGAIAAGARAVLCQEKLDAPGATQVIVSDPLKMLAPVSVRFWDAPSKQLLMVGITGTNGKTTVCYLVESLMKAAGKTPAILGTINYRYKNYNQAAPNTTPYANELQRFLAQALNDGVKACAMEVSSHALALGRVEGVDFDVAVFTNLTQDHLDFHKTVEEYGAAKMLLFKHLGPETTKPYPRCAVLNLDDPWTARIQTVCRVPVLGYSLKTAADVSATQVVCDASGSRFVLEARGYRPLPVQLKLLGEYNVANALAAAAVGVSQGWSAETLVQGLEAVSGVPGRMERVDAGQPFTVLVDYAHTEDALRNVLTALRRLNPSRILTVFGCGGDRDRIKRPLMGEVAARLSDEVFLTSDNPRSEDPERITLDAEVGIRKVRFDHYQIILEREAAIAAALRMARPGDVVLIAGKGHETYQILKDQTVAFDDREIARKYLTAPSRTA
jgi:UDP-N-acetylmuramoyl-L-alanyl-D-glutamate--2,6-diaminopimelate ligase